jgi:enamine deaminase RidA (YjgF/YER057c/UK114 family)
LERIKRVDIVLNIPNNAEIKKALENIKTKLKAIMKLQREKSFLAMHCQVMIVCLLQAMISKFMAKL